MAMIDTRIAEIEGLPARLRCRGRRRHSFPWSIPCYAQAEYLTGSDGQCACADVHPVGNDRGE